MTKHWTPELPWVPPRTKHTYVCKSGRPHLIGSACACTLHKT